MTICLDSSFIIDFLNGDTAAEHAMEKIKEEELVTTELCIFEVADGIFFWQEKRTVSKGAFERFLDFMSDVDILPTMNLFALESAKIRAQLRLRGETLDDMDCIIAGTMKASGCKQIITKNVMHFERIPGIKVISY